MALARHVWCAALAAPSTLILLLCATLISAASAQQRPRHGRLFPPEELGARRAGPRRVAEAGRDHGRARASPTARTSPNRRRRRLVHGAARPARGSERGRLRAGRPGQMLEAIRRRVEREGLRNVRTVLGDAERSPTAAGELDAVLIVDAYHEFTNPRRVARAARDGAEARRPDRRGGFQQGRRRPRPTDRRAGGRGTT